MIFFCPACYVALKSKLHKYRLGKELCLKLSICNSGNSSAEDFNALAHKCQEKAWDIDPSEQLINAKYI